MDLARQSDDTRVAALAINNLGDLRLSDGDYARAGPLFEESLALLRSRGDTANLARSLFNLGAVALMLDRLEDARGHFQESLALGRAAGDKEDLAWCLLGYAGLAAASGDCRRASLLLGSAVGLLEAMGAAFKPFERDLYDSTTEKARALCGDETFEAARLDGGALSLDLAIEYAMGTEVGSKSPVA